MSVEVERRAFVVETGDIHNPPPLLEEELTPRNVIEVWLAELPPSLVAVEVLSPLAMGQARLHVVIGLLRGKVDTAVADALAECFIPRALDEIGMGSSNRGTP